MDLTGYTDRLAVSPGESLEFKVSTGHTSYSADVVRLLHGDTHDKGPGFLEEVVETHVSGTYPGRAQPLTGGSFIEVLDSPRIRAVTGFTIAAWVFPTTPAKGLQGILTRWAGSNDWRFGLFISAGGRACLRLAAPDAAVFEVEAPTSLRPHFWYFVAASLDASTLEARVEVHPRLHFDRDDCGAATVPRSSPQFSQPAAPLLIAAVAQANGEGVWSAQHFFNGKIDQPRVFDRAFRPSEIRDLSVGEYSASDPALVAAWDFSEDLSSTFVSDVSGGRHTGRLVNCPMRAVTGHKWSGDEVDYKLAPQEYGAMYFHDDDLEDAEWETDFALNVPDLPSGIYAARLTAGSSEDYIPFVVRPPREGPTADLAFLVPTASYLAYANEHEAAGNPAAALSFAGIDNVDAHLQPADYYMLAQNLMSVYDRHSDGSGVCYSSWRRPILTMRPKYTTPVVQASHQFNADLSIVHWLHHLSAPTDFITDHDLHEKGAELLTKYRVVITGTHPEYYTAEMLDSMEMYLSQGGRLIYLGGNGFYWVASIAPGRPHLLEVRRGHAGSRPWESAAGESRHSTSGAVGGLWRHRGRNPQQLVGVGFTAQGGADGRPYSRCESSLDPRAAFIFEGVPTDSAIGSEGLVLGAAASFELDRADFALGTPPHALVLASAVGFSDIYQAAVEDVCASDSRQSGSVSPLVRADMVFFECPNGGAVFSVGSIGWAGSLSCSEYDNHVSRISSNVLSRFLSAEPFVLPDRDENAPTCSEVGRG